MLSQGSFSNTLPGSLSGIGFGKEVNWFVSHVDQCNGLFYLQQNEPSISVKYERQMQDIDAAVNGGKLKSFREAAPPVGCLCIAQYSEDGQWYRGQVLGSFDEDDSEVVEVVFIDYGNGEDLTWKSLKQVPQEFTDLPPQAIQCKLADVDPVGGAWSKEGVKYLKELLLERDLWGVPTHLCKSGAVVVKLFSDEGGMVAQELVKGGFAEWKKGKSSRRQSSSSGSTSGSLATSGSTSAVGSTSASVNDKSLGQSGGIKIGESSYSQEEKPSGNLGCDKYPARKPPTRSISSGSASGAGVPHFVSLEVNEGGCEIGYVAYAESPFDFSCQLSKSAANLEKLMEELNEECMKLKPGANKLGVFGEGVPCCARYSEDGRFYRAELKSSAGVNAVVHFVDYGNSDKCRLDELKHLRKEYLKLPKQAFRCKLAGIQADGGGTDLPPDVCAEFNNMVIDKEFKITFVGVDPQGVFEVSLIENNDRNVVEFDAAKVLINSNMVQPFRKLSKEDLGHTTTREKFKEIQIPKGDYIDVIPTYVTNPNEFYCQLIENSDKIDQLMEDLERTYKNSEPIKNNRLKTGMPCVALYPADKGWYRGSITNASGKHFDVNYVDFGNTERLHVDEVRLIHSEFMRLPAQAFVCSLSDAIPKRADDQRGAAEWPKDAVDKFSDLVLEKELVACLEAKDKANLHHVELLDLTNREQQTNIAEVLFEEGFAQKQSPDNEIKSFAGVELKPGAQETVYISHVDDVGNFYCQLTRHEDSIYTLLDKLNSKSIRYSRLDAFPKGTPLCALFSEDKSWYRGEVIMAIDSENAVVRFVDYGNSENVDISSMYEVPPEFMSEPRYGIHCCLRSGGMKWKDDAGKELGSMIGDKVLKMTVKDIIGGKYIIDLCDEDEVDVRSTLAQSVSKVKTAGEEATAKELAPMKEEAPVKERLAATKPKATKHAVNDCLPIKSGLTQDCFISYINSLKEFYVQPCSVEEDLEFVGQELQKSKPFAAENPPKRGDICSAKYSDGMLYRAEIIEIHESEVETLFFDYGNSDVVKLQDVKTLPESLLGIPRLSIGCYLAGVTSESIEDADCDGSFLDSIMDDVVAVKFLSKNVDDRYNVTLQIKGSLDAVGNVKKNPGLKVEVRGAAKEDNAAREESAAKEDNAAAVARASISSYSSVQSPAVIVEFNEKELKVGAVEKVYVSYVVTAQEFFCQLSRESDELNRMMDELEGYYSAQPPEQDSLTSLAAGLPCAAKYSVDGGWYRAALQGVQSPTEANVMFVDYGNTETVYIKELKILKEDFYQLPTFAVKCSLVGDVGTAGDFESKVLDKELELKVVGLNGSSYIIDLVCEGTSLISTLSQETAKEHSENLSTRGKGYKMVEIEKGTVFDVYYLDGKSPQNFLCHLAKYETEFETLASDLGATGASLETMKSFEAGTPCVALFSEDESWYRGKILESKGDSVKVEFIDYGNEEFVKYSNVKAMIDGLLGLPMQAVRFCLDNVSPAANGVWSEDEINSFKLKCGQKLLSATVSSISSDTIHVVLTDKETGETLNDAFRGSVENGPKLKQDDFEKLCFKIADVSKGMKLEALCTFVKENCQVSCQFIKYESELGDLMDAIAAYCDGDAKRVTDVKMDMACLALYNEDNCWYRGKVVKCGGENATIRFVDFGNESTCAVENLRLARPKDLELPVTCIDCRISGIEAKADLSAVIEKMCLEEEVIVDVKDVISGELVLADLLTVKNQESVCDMVNKAILQSNDARSSVKSSTKTGDRKYAKLTLDVGGSEKVLFTTVTSLKALSFQSLRHQNEFDEMMDNIAVHCEATREVLKNVAKGQICLGKYSVDEGWYRAEVISVSNEYVRLRYVDYGNEDDASISDTREMVDEFMKLPAMSITCKLHDVYEEDLDCVQAVKWMEDSCMENEFRISFVVKDGELYEVNMYSVESEENVGDKLYSSFALKEGVVAEDATAEVATTEGKDSNVGKKPPSAETGSVNVEAGAPSVEAGAPNEEAPTLNGEVKSTQREEKVNGIIDAESIGEMPSLRDVDEKLNYKELQLKPLVKIPSICSYVDDKLQIHCQPIEYTADLDQLMAHIADYCGEMQSSNVSLDAGAPCFALFPDDGEWYRAEVIKVDGDVLEVFYVDYGNHGKVKKNEVLSITKPFLKLPKACFPCTLQECLDVSPMIIDVKAWLEERLIGEEVEVELTSQHHGDSYLATLYHNGKGIGDNVKVEFQDMFTDKQKDIEVEKADKSSSHVKDSEPVKSDPLEKVEKVDKSSSHMKDSNQMEFAPLEVSCPSTERAICTHVESLHEIFIQLTKYQDQVYELSEKLQVYCSEVNTKPEGFEKGSSCLAKFTLDEQWYRAKVVENMKDSVKVIFVDYGNTDIVQSENTRILSSEFTSLPATSIKCHLHDVHDEDIDVTAALQWLQENVVEQELCLDIVGMISDSYDCILKKEGDEATVNDQLYYEFEVAAEEIAETVVSVRNATEETGKVAVSADNEGLHCDESEAQLNENEVQCAGNDVKTAEDIVDAMANGVPKEGENKGGEFFVGALKQQAPKLGAKESVKCTHVDALNCISIQFIQFQEEFDEMMTNISEFCEKSTKLPEKIEVGNVCLAKSEDGEWYRGEIASVSDDCVDVNFVDYGNIETVAKENTRVIPMQFALLPAMSVPCQLHDVNQSDIDVGKAEEWLHENLIEQEIDIEIIGKIDETYDIIITRKNESASVNSFLFEKFELQDDTAKVLEENVEAPESRDKESVIDNSVIHDQVVNDQVISDSVVNDPVIQGLMVHNEVVNDSVTNDPVTDDPLINHSMIKDPMVNDSAINDSMIQDSVIDDSAVIEPANELLNPDAVDFVPSTASVSKSLEVKSRDIASGSTLKLHLSFPVTPSLFWCQFEDSGPALIDMMAEIDDHYGNNSQPHFESIPEIGTIGCVKFSEDDKWYRGEVCEIFDEKTCMIHFIDYGNAEQVELSNIKELKAQFFNLRKQAVKCSLHGIEAIDGEWSDEAAFVFEDICAERILDAEFVNKGDAWEVVIKTDDDQKTVNDMMVEGMFGRKK